MATNTVRLYRFYNWEKSTHGEPFALCDEHKDKQVVPEYCILEWGGAARPPEGMGCVFCLGTITS